MTVLASLRRAVLRGSIRLVLLVLDVGIATCGCGIYRQLRAESAEVEL